MNASKKVEFRTSLVSILACLVFGIAAFVSVTPAKGDKPVPPPPPLPPVKYLVTWLDSLGRTDVITGDVNSLGQVVGEARNLSADGTAYVNRTAFVYDPSLDFAIDGLVDGDVCDLNVLTPVLGWTLRQAWGINELSQIVGSAQNNTTGESRGFVINAAWNECVLLPSPIPSHPSGQYAKRINNFGDVLAMEGGGWITAYTWNGTSNTYDVTGSWQQNSTSTAFNDFGQILLVNGQRYTPGTGWTNFATTYGINFAMGMNNSGMFVGGRSVGRTRYCFRFTDPNQMFDIAQGVRATSDINADGDVCLMPGGGSRGSIYTNHDGLLALDNMVDGTVGNVANWKNAVITYTEAMSDDVVFPPNTGFGFICGRGVFSTKGSSISTTKAYLLTPHQ
ncbi:MAG: hypothetical protein ABL921_01195 [Pirellula sp.]